MTVIAAAVAAVTAVFQFYADTIVFRSIFSGRVVKAVAALSMKLLIYAGAFAVLFLKFRSCAVGAAVGFGVGFFPSLATYGIYSVRKNKNTDEAKNTPLTSGGGE